MHENQYLMLAPEPSLSLHKKRRSSLWVQPELSLSIWPFVIRHINYAQPCYSHYAALRPHLPHNAIASQSAELVALEFALMSTFLLRRCAKNWVSRQWHRKRPETSAKRHTRKKLDKKLQSQDGDERTGLADLELHSGVWLVAGWLFRKLATKENLRERDLVECRRLINRICSGATREAECAIEDLLLARSTFKSTE